MSEEEQYILRWINEVSKVRKELNGFAICPFASKSKYNIIKCDAKDIKPIEGLDVAIYIIENDFNLDQVQEWVEYHNNIHKEWKFFEDCGNYNTLY